MPDIFISPRRRREKEVATDVSPGEFISDDNDDTPIKTGKTITPSIKATPKKVEVESHFGKHEGSKPMFSLASFARHPSGVYFVNQAENEEIHLFLRKHFITNVPWIVLSIFLFLVPPFLFPLLTGLLPVTILPRLPIVVLAFYYVVVFGSIVLASFINWYFNVYIVTDERVIDIDFINIIYREVSATRLNLIQDVTVKTGGVIRTIFDYGDVFIQTAGTEENFDFVAVPHPQEVAREIERLMEQARKEEGPSGLEEQLEK